MTSESIFCAGIGIQPEAWEASNHGVIFKVSVRVANEETVQIYSRRLDPRARAEDRNWIEVRVPLDRYFGMAVKVILSTEPAFENDVDYGWAAWSEPRVQLNVQ
jgi:hypothetical protein